MNEYYLTAGATNG